MLKQVIKTSLELMFSCEQYPKHQHNNHHNLVFCIFSFFLKEHRKPLELKPENVAVEDLSVCFVSSLLYLFFLRGRSNSALWRGKILSLTEKALSTHTHTPSQKDAQHLGSAQLKMWPHFKVNVGTAHSHWSCCGPHPYRVDKTPLRIQVDVACHKKSIKL